MMQIQDGQIEIPARVARRQLLWLGVAHCAQTAATGCLFFSALGDAYYAFRWNPWGMLWVYLFIPVPFLIPAISAISNRLPARTLMLGCGAANIALLAAFAPSFPLRAYDGIWYLALPMFAMIHLTFCTARDALLPGAATDARLPLGRVVSLMIFAGLAGILVGLFCEETSKNGLYLSQSVLPNSVGNGLLRITQAMHEQRVDPIALMLGTLYCVFLAAVDHVRFATEVHTSRSWFHELGAFFTSSRLLLKQRPVRAAIVGRSLAFGFIAAGGCILVGTFPRGLQYSLASLRTFLWTCLGVALGCGIAFLQRHPRRLLGWVPLAATGVFIAYWLANDAWDVAPPFIVFGALCSMLIIPLWATYLGLLAAGARRNGVALGNTIAYLLGGMIAIGYFQITRAWLARLDWDVGFALGLIFCGVGLAWTAYFRKTLDWLVEIAIWPVYRIRAYGPGRNGMPLTGPVLVVANHSSWFDPIWIAKVVPRRVRPMMTSRFYDLRGLRWLMIHVVGAIRVQLSTYRREAPELDQAIALLDQGECVLMFPEGRMRRTAELPLRNFGQGVWHILSQRPATPVVVCWIEGGWGSYFSYAGGPPTKNKRFDFWRSILIGIEAPQLIDPELLKDQRATRRHLMQVSLDARRHLGLAPLAKIDSLQDEAEMAADANDAN
jgi:1-acyl-sn-glycerol-3-phosphate acyltransferase